MFSSNIHKTLLLTVTAAVSCFVAPHQVAAASPDTGADVTFTATGTFAATPISGADTLLLRGQPFSISVVANSSLTPSQHNKNWALFMPLNMSGNVFSGLLPNQPIPVAAATAAIFQANGASEDIFQSGFPVEVIGIALTARAYITMPGGTISTPLIRTFSSVALDPSNATVSYSNGTATTVLAVDSGTLVATLQPPGAPRAGMVLPFGMDELGAVRPVFGNPGDFFGLGDADTFLARRRAARMASQVAMTLNNSKVTRIHIQ